MATPEFAENILKELILSDPLYIKSLGIIPKAVNAETCELHFKASTVVDNSGNQWRQTKCHITVQLDRTTNTYSVYATRYNRSYDRLVVNFKNFIQAGELWETIREMTQK